MEARTCTANWLAARVPLPSALRAATFSPGEGMRLRRSKEAVGKKRNPTSKKPSEQRKILSHQMGQFAIKFHPQSGCQRPVEPTQWWYLTTGVRDALAVGPTRQKTPDPTEPSERGMIIWQLAIEFHTPSGYQRPVEPTQWWDRRSP